MTEMADDGEVIEGVLWDGPVPDECFQRVTVDGAEQRFFNGGWADVGYVSPGPGYPHYSPNLKVTWHTMPHVPPTPTGPSAHYIVDGERIQEAIIDDRGEFRGWRDVR